MTPTARAAFSASVLDPLAQLGDATEFVLYAIDQLAPHDRWLSEVRDGVAIDLARTRFAEANYRAALAFADGGTDGGWLARADAALADARAVVDIRHAHLHALDRTPLISRHRNSTLYGFGYLYMAQTLCYWNRERAQIRNLILHTADPDPGCAL